MKYLFLFFFLFSINSLSAKYYFQQEVSYEIHVSLDDVKHELTATTTIKYVNHSLDSLRDLYFHLWPNAYKNKRTALAEQLSDQGSNAFINTKEEDRGSIDNLNFRVDGKTVDWEFLEDTIDICLLHLKKPLAPKESITITTPFKVKIPSADISRLGHLGQSYMITQWFPKPAVYDEHKWNYFSYLDQGEFYSEFGTFDVYLTLPKNYVVGATGDLVNGEQELAWLDEKVKETNSFIDSTTNHRAMIMLKHQPNMFFPASDIELKTLHYHVENVHDFAWFADKRWHVLKGEVVLPESQRKVTTWAMFTNAELGYWKKSTEYITDALLYYSKWLGEYPYNQVSAVDVTDASGNGMEYPMITAIGNYGSAFELEATIAHEVGHNWFYGILGSNERIHPWMDEGMNQFFETRYIYTKYAGDSSKQMEETNRLGFFGKVLGLTGFNHRRLQYLAYQNSARNNTDQQPDMESQYFSRFNYGADVYRKTALAFDHLKSYLGDSIFDLCMHEYYSQWKFKHPMPEDVKEIFEKVSGKKLDWLFLNMLNSPDKVDYKITSLKKADDNYTVQIRNKGTVASPVSLSAVKNGKVVYTKWYEGGIEGSKSFQFSCTDCDAIKIDGEEKTPDINRKNNTIKTSGVLRKTERLKIQWPIALDNPDYTQLFASPVAGWNNYNKWMLGVAAYNFTFPEKRFEYMLMPLYSPSSKQLAGGGRLNYNLYVNNSILNKINISTGYAGYSFQHVITPDLNESRYLNFYRVSSSMTFNFYNRKHNVNEYNSITLRDVWTEYDMIVPCASCGFQTEKHSRLFNFGEYRLGNPVTYNPYHFKFSVGATEGLLLAAFEFRQIISFKEKGRGIEYRIFTGFNGKTNEHTQTDYFDMRLHMDGQSGQDDYLFDETFAGRTETKGLLSQQFTATQGGFKTATSFAGQSELWLATINLKVAFPYKLPLYLFADVGAYSIPETMLNILRKNSMYDYGVEFRIIRDIFAIYFPLGYSNEIKKIYDSNPDQFKKYGQKIRFELNLSKLNPFTLRDHVRL